MREKFNVKCWNANYFTARDTNLNSLALRACFRRPKFTGFCEAFLEGK